MKITSFQLKIMLSAFIIYLIIIIGYSTKWFRESIDMESNFVWWLIGAFWFTTVVSMIWTYLKNQK